MKEEEAAATQLQLSQHGRRRQGDCLVHLQVVAEMGIVTVPDGVLQTAEGLAGLVNLAGHFVVDFGVTREDVARVGAVVHDLQLGAIHVDLGCDVGSVVGRLMHGRRILRVDDQAEFVAGGSEEMRTT
nr:unnamed protein product [Spirometra erinaceieuropaei]